MSGSTGPPSRSLGRSTARSASRTRSGPETAQWTPSQDAVRSPMVSRAPRSRQARLRPDAAAEWERGRHRRSCRPGAPGRRASKLGARTMRGELSDGGRGRRAVSPRLVARPTRSAAGQGRTAAIGSAVTFEPMCAERGGSSIDRYARRLEDILEVGRVWLRTRPPPSTASRAIATDGAASESRQARSRSRSSSGHDRWRRK